MDNQPGQVGPLEQELVKMRSKLAELERAKADLERAVAACPAMRQFPDPKTFANAAALVRVR